MAKRRQCGQILLAEFILGAICCATTGDSLLSQTDPTSQPAATAKAPSYEIVSIKPSNPKSGTIALLYLPEGLDSINLPLQPLVKDAYDVDLDSQISGLPGWASSERYDVQARVDADTAEAWKKLPDKELIIRQRPMIQSLLADRCKLKVHLETREFPVYDLVIAKGGLKMKEAPSDENHGGLIKDGSITGHATSFGLLLANLTPFSGRKVIDKTGLDGKRFDFELEWAPDDQPATAVPLPSLFTALKEQLGLELVPAKEPMQVVVIDHMERPSAN
jgi:uncharacterized protein (TIGR03435 family)